MSEVKTLDFVFRQAARRNYTQAAGTELLLVRCCTALSLRTDEEKIPTFTLAMLWWAHTVRDTQEKQSINISRVRKLMLSYHD